MTLSLHALKQRISIPDLKQKLPFQGLIDKTQHGKDSYSSKAGGYSSDCYTPDDGDLFDQVAKKYDNEEAATQKNLPPPSGIPKHLLVVSDG